MYSKRNTCSFTIGQVVLVQKTKLQHPGKLHKSYDGKCVIVSQNSPLTYVRGEFVNFLDLQKLFKVHVKQLKTFYTHSTRSESSTDSDNSDKVLSQPPQMPISDIINCEFSSSENPQHIIRSGRTIRKPHYLKDKVIKFFECSILTTIN